MFLTIANISSPKIIQAAATDLFLPDISNKDRSITCKVAAYSYTNARAEDESLR